MSLNRWAKKRDSNEASIVNILRTFGATVIRSDAVDLIVGFRGKNYLLEVKTKTGVLKPSQIHLRDFWAGKYDIVRNEHEALRAIGVDV
jgi:hypothetical protein